MAKPKSARATAADAGEAAVPPFLSKTYELVDDPHTNAIVSWSLNGVSFLIWRPEEFSQNLLPCYFKHNKLPSFLRQLNTYGFRKVEGSEESAAEFSHRERLFARGRPELLAAIRRHKAGGRDSPPAAAGSPSAAEPQAGGPSSALAAELDRERAARELLTCKLMRLQGLLQESQAEAAALRDSLQHSQARQQAMLQLLQAGGPGAGQPPPAGSLTAAVAAAAAAEDWQQPGACDSPAAAAAAVAAAAAAAAADEAWQQPGAKRQRSTDSPSEAEAGGALPEQQAAQQLQQELQSALALQCSCQSEDWAAGQCDPISPLAASAGQLALQPHLPLPPGPALEQQQQQQQQQAGGCGQETGALWAQQQQQQQQLVWVTACAAGPWEAPNSLADTPPTEQPPGSPVQAMAQQAMSQHAFAEACGGALLPAVPTLSGCAPPDSGPSSSSGGGGETALCPPTAVAVAQAAAVACPGSAGACWGSLA